MFNKYFNPVEKNIKVPLLEIDTMASPAREALQALTGRGNSTIREQEAIKIKNRKLLRESIFGGKKTFNKSVFEESVELFSTNAYQEEDLSTLILTGQVNDENVDNNLSHLQKRATKEKKRALGERCMNVEQVGMA